MRTLTPVSSSSTEDVEETEIASILSKNVWRSAPGGNRRELGNTSDSVDQLNFHKPLDIAEESRVTWRNNHEDVKDDVNPMNEVDYVEKKVLAIQRDSLSPYNIPELCGLPEEHGSCYDDILRWRYN
ncbi:unnamed protein product [Nippostrongylus brasiliensis]|uniref:ELM2 domain-containing protein n=1 Tax=Nippostrongylus brasiliensis TaxID=27835 RepID=A0A0N4YS18_NIPBR|nr:unnamed protein product [Nippostrongylus brasiliensis]